MQDEKARLSTYSDWKFSYIVNPIDLARNGFYYIGFADTVQCAFCAVFVGKWEKGDVPEEGHALFEPNCPFVLGYEVGNVPLTVDPKRNQLLSHFNNLLEAEEQVRNSKHLIFII